MTAIIMAEAHGNCSSDNALYKNGLLLLFIISSCILNIIIKLWVHFGKYRKKSIIWVSSLKPICQHLIQCYFIQGQKKRKTVQVCCPQVKFLKKLGRSIRALLFFEKHPKVLNLGAFSAIFMKKTPNLNRYVHFLSYNYFYSYFWTRVGRWSQGQHNNTLLLGLMFIFTSMTWHIQLSFLI